MKKVAKTITILLLSILFFYSFELSVMAQQYTFNTTSFQVYQENNGQKCGVMTGCAVAGQDIQVEINGIKLSDGTPLEGDGSIEYVIRGEGPGCNNWPRPANGGNRFAGYLENGNLNLSMPGDMVMSGCQYSIELYKMVVDGVGTEGDDVRQFKLNTNLSPKIQASCNADQCSEDLGLTQTSLYKLCDQLKTGTPQYSACMACFTSEGIWTAVGCVPSNPESIIKMVVSVGLAVGGGVVLIMILVGSFMLSVSQGDPNKTKEAKEIITSAVIGLLFVIFSVTILQFIGVSVLKIPGFGE